MCLNGLMMGIHYLTSPIMVFLQQGIRNLAIVLKQEMSFALTNMPDEAGTLIESMDACFGLVRKKTSGKAQFMSRHNSILFHNQEVDSFVDNYTSSAKQAKTDCHEFKAGEVNDMIRSKGRNKLFDEKGVFGGVCRHDYPKGFMNIKHGKR
ncbi:uncharacterized protein LOC124456069 [Xenia sp. Carnegie-2017]|uniref:uncharacterized protein LOC124456069 n=1 Tax=Xenia sp. Carnegie-2017 TaxID=2897299 RepID=UPI001F04F604|nr:uncharacterized protein LOC124456069 [Xenia sp. Carnegie-2017]